MGHSSKIIVTGVAGFIGSTLAERLLNEGHTVIGVDMVNDHYDPRIKKRNLAALLDFDTFTFHRKPILEMDWAPIMRGAATVFHQAALTGVRASWGRSFDCYTEWNIQSTQHLLEQMKGSGARMVYASSSSVYGETKKLPMNEDDRPQPMSPCGVSKLAAEHLAVLYWRNFGVETVSLRYFTVYGPRQRPDMAFHKFIRAALAGEPIILYGDGSQTRDFTYIDDAVEANIRAAQHGRPGGVYNIGGGSRVSVDQVLSEMETILDRSIQVNRVERQHGAVTHSYADTTRAADDLGFTPRVSLKEGLAREAEWIHQTYELLTGSGVRNFHHEASFVAPSRRLILLLVLSVVLGASIFEARAEIPRGWNYWSEKISSMDAKSLRKRYHHWYDRQHGVFEDIDTSLPPDLPVAIKNTNCPPWFFAYYLAPRPIYHASGPLLEEFERRDQPFALVTIAWSEDDGTSFSIERFSDSAVAP